MADELVLKKGPFKFEPKLTGLAAKRAAALAASGLVEPRTMEHRIGIVFDDSGSMAGAAIQDAHDGVEEFLRSCVPQSTAVTVYPMNAKPIALSSELPAIALLVRNIPATGGTPAVETAQYMVQYNSLTRAILFSDGSPRTRDYTPLLAAKIPFDTVYIADEYYEDPGAIAFMQGLAKDTDGIFLKFKRGSANFKNAFKYLSPPMRHLLADRAFMDRIQG